MSVDYIMQSVISNVDDKYLLGLLITWVVANVVTFAWQPSPDKGSKWYILYITVKTATLIPIGTVVSRLKNRKEKEDATKDSKRSP